MKERNKITKINYQLLHEMESLSNKCPSHEHILIKKLLQELYKISQGKKSKTIYHPHLLPLSYSKLEEIYRLVVANKKYTIPKIKESYPTFFENSFAKIFKNTSNLKFYKSFWIENRCFDIFIPRLMIIMEIDGGIHNDELKMRKDICAEKEMKRNYKISIGRINNSDQHRFLSTIYSLVNESKRVSSHRIKSTMANIYINTIAHDCSLSEVQRYLITHLGPNSVLYINDLSYNGRKYLEKHT